MAGQVAVPALDAEWICEVFDRLFGLPLNTRLRGGADEPLYLPATDSAPATIFFRLDYPASALHEVAHWCIAGEERRSQRDYGYWYDADGRSAEAQAAFSRVEARPQALEWWFSRAAGLPFRISLDNLDRPPDPHAELSFANAVVAQARSLQASGLPHRAARFFWALRDARQVILAAGQGAETKERADPLAMTFSVEELL